MADGDFAGSQGKGQRVEAIHMTKGRFACPTFLSRNRKNHQDKKTKEKLCRWNTPRQSFSIFTEMRNLYGKRSITRCLIS
ncbi:MAG: hypothetical protein CVU99_13905 [Firmicutes bacterium HGW-Firmicutes-4]|nr:MAG: hypothetical protein CVU99_13905 [Firmicutes bacterium HGW-Firmicutes-4]